MLKNIFNWTIGSFFRTLGRFLFFIVFGLVLGYIFTYNNINIPFFNLGKVNASYYQYQTLWYDSQGRELPQWYGQYIDFTEGINYTDFIWDAKPDVSLHSGTTEVLFQVYLRNFTYVNYFNCTGNINSSGVCERWKLQDGIDLNFTAFWNGSSVVTPCHFIDFDSPSTNSLSYQYHSAILSCLAPDNVRTLDRIAYKGSVPCYDGSCHNYSIGFERFIYMNYTDTSDIKNLIENQTQQQRDFYNDTNATSQVESTADFFTNSTIGSSSGPLESILSTPLSLVNGLVTGSTADFCTTWKEKQICLSSGSILWNSDRPGLSAFITFFNLVVGGYLLWRSLVHLFRTTEEILDPLSKKEVEVLNL